MFDLKKIVRKNILHLKPYSSARDEFANTQKHIHLDANENPYGVYNRYPDPYQNTLKQKLSAIKKVDPDSIFVGNGSDEIIDLVFRIFCQPRKDKALIFTPTYGMYQVAANIHEIALYKVPLNNVFQIDFQKVLPFMNDEKLKVLFICSPNNPTGNSIDTEIIEKILQHFRGVVVLDEAYIDFSKKPSLSRSIKKYPNLIVCQTFSKAYGLAGIRIGLAYADRKIINLLNKVKPPYNVSVLNQRMAVKMLLETEKFQERKRKILQQKKYLQEALQGIASIKKIYPSDANFLLVQVTDANMLYRTLIAKGIVIRNRNAVLKNTVRITVGTAQENQKLIQTLKAI